ADCVGVVSCRLCFVVLHFSSVFFFFFFSSRRRHTRWPRDWSSDVCSSDLRGVRAPRRGGPHAVRLLERELGTAGAGGRQSHGPRSEERRVGKECRCRWWRGQEKKR